MFDGRPCRDSTGWVAVVRKRRCFGFCWISSLFSWPASCLCLWLFGGNVSFIFPENLELEALDPEALGLQATCMKYYSSQTVFILCSSHLAEPQFRYHMEVLGACFLNWLEMCLDFKFYANQKHSLNGKICHLHQWITIKKYLLLESHCQLRTDCILCNLSLFAPECSKYERFAVTVCCMLLC